MSDDNKIDPCRACGREATVELCGFFLVGCDECANENDGEGYTASGVTKAKAIEFWNEMQSDAWNGVEES